MIDRIGAGSSQHRVSHGIVYGVIERGRAIGPPHYPQGDKIRTPLREEGMGQETIRRKIGDELAGCPHQFLHYFTPLRPAKINRD
ncbi:hypothetical protein GCM10011349_46750 [Novosphingobium indicum]|jgi:hypothetical protein|uniref:Uncharacterized protein n=1 Tax=Novosphingobium indicum TaxID=462949 RepID=A0ABQ2K0Z7_9SPHN|nr:hypothetical protein GCM10011349_46750 [Novosphingobium indicum]